MAAMERTDTPAGSVSRTIFLNFFFFFEKLRTFESDLEKEKNIFCDISNNRQYKDLKPAASVSAQSFHTRCRSGLLDGKTHCQP